jgi:hypothetical protein
LRSDVTLAITPALSSEEREKSAASLENSAV